MKWRLMEHLVMDKGVVGLRTFWFMIIRVLDMDARAQKEHQHVKCRLYENFIHSTELILYDVAQ